MEYIVKTKCVFPSIESARWAKAMLSDDPPLFEDELPKLFEPIFHAFEDCEPPHKHRFSGKNSLTMEWVSDSSWLENLKAFHSTLSDIDEIRIVTCAVGDEDILILKDGNVDVMLDGRSIIEVASITIDDDIGWITKLLNYLIKNY